MNNNNNNNNNNNLRGSSSISSPSTKCDILVSPIKSYENAELFKGAILEESRNQSGIYRWVNNLNNKSYVGSGINLASRLGSYYNKNELNRNSRPIKDALHMDTIISL